MDATHERELVERCQRGDEGAFQELVERYKNLVFALIARTVRDQSRAEDLAQDVFLRVYRGLPYFRGEARLSTWIYRIAANACAQELTRRPPPASLDTPDGDRRATAKETLGSRDRQFGDIELRDRLDKAIARLPAQYRLIIAAHYLDGMRYEDLADALQLPVGTLKTQLYRAKQQLRRLLETEMR
jgi:RNA polymerase sigma-70 factor (ECF subfamily)